MCQTCHHCILIVHKDMTGGRSQGWISLKMRQYIYVGQAHRKQTNEILTSTGVRGSAAAPRLIPITQETSQVAQLSNYSIGNLTLRSSSISAANTGLGRAETGLLAERQLGHPI